MISFQSVVLMLVAVTAKAAIVRYDSDPVQQFMMAG